MSGVWICDQSDGASCGTTASGKRLREGGGGPQRIIPTCNEQHSAARTLDWDGRCHSRLRVGAQAGLIERAKADGLLANWRRPCLVIGDEWQRLAAPGP